MTKSLADTEYPNATSVTYPVGDSSFATQVDLCLRLTQSLHFWNLPVPLL
jgi:hypothetical protein